MTEKTNENYTPNDNEILEMSNHFKEVLDRKDKEKREIVKKYNSIFSLI